jgi:diguanylate cyclase (GGDEF)-like protein
MTQRLTFRMFRWQRARRVLLSFGPAGATLVLTLAAALMALAVSQGTLLLAGLGPNAMAGAMALLCAGLVAPPILWPLIRLWADAEAARADLDVLATRDDLTGVLNRRQFLVLAEREWARCIRYEMSAALLMIDVDHFKDINDRHGHLAGDLMLREIARAAGGTLRQPDLFGRFGGEEFIAFLPHTDTLGAIDAAERIREAVTQLALEWRGQTMRTTVSLGVISLDRSHESLGALIADADLALYTAKDAGRNCVRTGLNPQLVGRVQGAELPLGGTHNNTP